MKDELSRVAEQLKAIPGTCVELSAFPSGAAMLDVRRHGRLFVMAYLPTYAMFGVDEVGEAEGFLTSYRFTSPTLAPAAERLRQLVTKAGEASEATPDPAIRLEKVREPQRSNRRRTPRR